MSVFGGRRWVAAALRGSALAGFSLAWVAGCGGRTSMLDEDVYTSSYAGISSGGSGATAAMGGSGTATAGGGSTGAGAAGTSSGGGTGTLNPSLAVGPCTSYCPGYGTQCRQRLTSPDCQGTCESELNGYGAACQALGVQTLACLTPFFTPNASNCDAAVNRALGKCNSLVKRFDACKKGFRATSSPPGNPGMSTPASNPEQTNLMGCSTLLEETQPKTCQHIFDCNDSPYIINCHTDAATMLASCECSGPNGTVQVTVPGVANPCPLAVDSCY